MNKIDALISFLIPASAGLIVAGIVAVVNANTEQVELAKFRRSEYLTDGNPEYLYYVYDIDRGVYVLLYIETPPEASYLIGTFLNIPVEIVNENFERYQS